MKHQTFTTKLIIFVTLYISLVNCESDIIEFTKDEAKQVMCTKKLRQISSLTYSPLACLAETMGANFSDPKVPFPEKFVKMNDPSIAKWSVLNNLDDYIKWICSDFDKNFKIVKDTQLKLDGLDEDEKKYYSKCLIDELAVTIEEEVCINKTTLGLTMESERVKCMKQSIDPKEPCLKEMIGEDLDEKKVTQWLCQEEPNPERYVAAELVCVFGKGKEMIKKYDTCLHQAVIKIMK